MGTDEREDTEPRRERQRHVRNWVLHRMMEMDPLDRRSLGAILLDPVWQPVEAVLALEKMRELMRELQEIEDGPGDSNSRARKMRSTLVDYSLVGRRRNKAGDDGFAWLECLTEGATAQEALEEVARKHGRERGRVQKSIEEYFKRQGVRPPVPIPQQR